ncbi:hypothetical protein E0E62_19545 [Streptomyces sp. 16-176A]|nr:hypothetical protein [Streptomyces sp. SID5998]MYX30049.1 hypothetical protein [Streptomyces sp. SID8381]MYX42365.1 hypothetical protein [Streptomyces sp. SID89]
MVRDHGFGCAQQMQGQMHVHVTELDPHVPLVGHFFRHPRVRLMPPSCRGLHDFCDLFPFP